MGNTRELKRILTSSSCCFTFILRCVNILTRFVMNFRAHIFVRGRVQGVFFRDHTRRWASSLGLTGWVRNLYDGGVEVMVEGERDIINNLINRLEEGPPLSHVEEVKVSWEDYQGEFDEFRITWADF